MNKKLIQLLWILLFAAHCIVRSNSLSSNSLRGVSPEDERYYNTASEFIKCKDGSKKINRNQLNDDFCDCVDGSDEPGTSACPNGSFYCRNVGHMPRILFSSRVNDGICDCCDGSDEYDGKVQCTNTCWEAGKAARDKLKKKIATYQEGVILRSKEIEQSKVAIAKDEAELSKLKNEEKVLKDLVQQLKERKEQIEKAEEKERLEKEKEEKLQKATEKESDQEKVEDDEKVENEKEKLDVSTHDDVIGNLDDSLEQGIEEMNSKTDQVEETSNNAAELPTKESDEVLTVASESGSDYEKEPEKESNEELNVASESGSDHEKEHETAGLENTEGLSKEELGRLVASRWTGEKKDHKSADPDDFKDIDRMDETPKDLNEEDYDGYASETDEDHKYDDDANEHSYDENDADDHVDDDSIPDDHEDSSSYRSDSDDESVESGMSNPSWLKKIQMAVKNILQAVSLFQTPLNISDAAQVRKEYDGSSSKLSKIQSRISSLSEKLKHDFGPEKEFYPLYDHCFETKQNKYVYKVCPFKKATQEEGHMTTRLGQWEKFEDSYKVMLFSNGDKCWNGPDRSLKVKLRCGLKNEVTDVDEPSRCEYVALLSTPGVCLEEKLKELQAKLDILNREQPPNHDEL